MAPVALDSRWSYVPVALVTSHAAAVVYLTSIIGLGLYRSHKGLGPAQDTRQRISQRKKLTTAFGSLAVLGFLLSAGSTFSYLKLSYNVWAAERGLEDSNSLLSVSPYYTSNGTVNASALTRWLNETPVYHDAFEIVTEKARRLWWGQQLDLASVSWTMLLAIEGRRRQIPFLWAYALLSQLVGLSFAQNLFHVAMLLTPTPIALHDSKIARLVNSIFPPKPANWTPKPLFFILSVILNSGVALFLPYAAGTTWFPAAIWLSKGLSLAPLVLPAIIPQSWGSTYSDYHESYDATTRLFQLASTASALLHAQTSIASILSNLPDAYKHRHSIKIPFDTEKRSAWERSATAFERVLGSMSDHPVVAAAGKDVLLSGLSIGLWAAVRAMDVGDILKSAVPRHKTAENTPSHVASPDTTDGATPPSKSPTPAPETSMTLRRRDRASSSRYSSVRGSVGPEENGTPSPTPRRRGRPRKVKPEPEHDPEEDHEDATYVPTPDDDDKTSVMGDVLPGDDFDWESAALAWGLTALGDLGWEAVRCMGPSASRDEAIKALQGSYWGKSACIFS